MDRGKGKYYAVQVGRNPGIYKSWDDCKTNVSGYSGAIFKSFPSEAAAKEFAMGGGHNTSHSSSSSSSSSSYSKQSYSGSSYSNPSKHHSTGYDHHHHHSSSMSSRSSEYSTQPSRGSSHSQYGRSSSANSSYDDANDSYSPPLPSYSSSKAASSSTTSATSAATKTSSGHREKSSHSSASASASTSKEYYTNPSKKTKEDVMKPTILRFDGGSRGNPGIAGAGWAIWTEKDDSEPSVKGNKYLGRGTNNEAEYHALINGLKDAASMGVKNIHIEGDSSLVINQVQDAWKVSQKGKHLLPLKEEAQKIIREQFDTVTMKQVPRELNSVADEQSNIAMDKGKR